MIDYMVLGVIAALALLAWQIIRAQRKQGGGCGGGGGGGGGGRGVAARCSSACPSRDQKEEDK